VGGSVDNRQKLAAAALELFAAHGYDAIGVQEICDAVGVRKPTLYHYYGSKRGLLEAIVAVRGEPFMAELAVAAAYDGNLPLTLQRIVAAYFRFTGREPVLYRLLLAAWLTDPANEAYQIVASFNARQRQLATMMFEAAGADHGNMRGRHRINGATFLGVIHAYCALGLAGELVFDAALERQVVQQFSYGIYS
jgi:AcrR family transcriptional regulator